MSDRRSSEAQDLILAAALSPERWKDVLHFLAEATDCVAGGITIEDAATRKGEPLVYFGFDPDHVRGTFDYYLPMNPLFGIAESMRPGFVVTNGDVIHEQVFRRSEFYDGWARPQGLCCPTTVVLNRTGEKYCPLTLVRPDGKGDVTATSLRWLKGLVPRLVRAMEITVELDTRSLDLTAFDIAIAGNNLGMVVLDEEGRIVHANKVAEARLQCGLGLRQHRGKLHGDTPRIDQQLESAVELAHKCKTFSEDIRVEAEGRPPILVKVIPLPTQHGFARIVGGRPSLLLIFRDAPIDLKRRLNYIGDVYGLTPAERRVLSAFIDGTETRSTAAALGISVSTLKTHLANIFAKTNTTRQSALVGLVLKGIERSD